MASVCSSCGRTDDELQVVDAGDDLLLVCTDCETEIPDLFLNLLGLQVELDLELVVTAAEGQGLLGDLLVGLLGSN